ncbi:MAG TPA: peptide deformylase [Flavobacteriaceae bacterium]|nr:peptide deformylase [Flavobacteriaceae bacterium]
MILPILGYGFPILKREAKEIPEDFENLEELIDNMWETMYNANGVGLAAPQVGQSIRLFVTDPTIFADDEELSDEERQQLFRAKKVFINPIILEFKGDEWAYTEGCLSIPGINEDIYRPEKITIEYFDQDFNLQTEEFSGLAARVIQHEYDHIEGILFTDKISNLKKRLIKSKLKNITKGKVDVDYNMRFSEAKKVR